MTQATHIPGHPPFDPHLPVRTYYVIFAALMGLLVLTVAAAFLPHSERFPSLPIIVALMIATAKAVMVILYFMHVKGSSALTKIFVIAAFIWFGILLGLTFSDYFTRSWLPHSRGWNDNPIRAERHVPRQPSLEPRGAHEAAPH